MTTKIYALFDPREPLQVRYVGKTVQELKVRLATHLSECRSDWYSFSPKNRWFRQLFAVGVSPEIKLLGEVDESQVKTAERKWIKLSKRQKRNIGQIGPISLDRNL